MLESLLFGILTSSLVVLADRYDQEAAGKKSSRARQLRGIAEQLRSSRQMASILVNETLRNSAGNGLAERIGSDPVLGYELAQWILDPAPENSEATRRALVVQLAEQTRIPEGEIVDFLERLQSRVFSHPEISRLRADQKLDALLLQVLELGDLRNVVERQQLYVTRALEAFLERERRQHLTPVIPRYRAWTEGNGLLHGDRPSDADMDEEIDFQRTQFSKVMEEIQETVSLPAAFVFLAAPQLGKTTFLKRVGWELARDGCAVVQLQAGARGEPYGKWLIEAAEQLRNPPLIVLIDDPQKDRDHFQSQMSSLSDRRAPVLCLIASRRSDWQQIESERVPILRKATEVSLEPDASEWEKILRELIEREIVTIVPDRYKELVSELKALPAVKGYFHSVIRLASEDRFRPTSVLVEEKLQKMSGNPEAEAFQRFYGFVCLFGMVGLPLPKDVARALFSDEERYSVRRFSEAIASPPMGWADDGIHASHETHAAAFFENRSLKAQLDHFLDRSLEAAELRSSAGEILQLLSRRGHEDLTLKSWSTLAPRLPTGYWQSCSAPTLAFAWGIFLFNNSVTDLAEVVFTHAAEKDSEPFVTAAALVNKGVSLGALDRGEEEIAVYEELDRRFGAREELSLLEQVAHALFNKGVSLGALDRGEEEIAVYEELDRRFGAREELPLLERVAKALVNKGVSLGALDRGEEAIAVYEELDRRFGAREELPLLEPVAKALVNKGVSLGALDRGEEAIAVYEELDRRFGAREELPLLERVAQALFNKGVSLGALDRGEEAIAVYEELDRRFGAREELSLLERVAQALFNKGVRLGALDRGEEEIAVYEELDRRFGAREELSLLEPVAQALVNKGVRLGALDRGEEEIAVYEELDRRFGAREELPLLEQVAQALFNKGVRLGALDRGEEEIAVYEELDRRFGAREELPLLEQVAQALFNKGVSLGALDRGEEEIAVYEELDRRFGAREELSLLEPVAQALVNKGVRLGALDRGEEEIAVYEELDRRFGAREELPLLEPVAQALVNKGVSLGALDRGEEAIAVYEELDRRFGAREELPLLEPVAQALVNKGVRLGALDRGEEAIAVYEELDRRFGAREELSLLEQVAQRSSTRA